MDLVVTLVLPLAVMVGLWFWSSAISSAHQAELAARERSLTGFLITDLRTFPGRTPSDNRSHMVATSVVLGAGFAVSVSAGLRSLVGGEVRGLTAVTQRARREAVLRLVDEARAGGFNAICNLRIEMTQAAELMAEVHIYGTAYVATAPAPGQARA